jgi:hypothetical protein
VDGGGVAETGRLADIVGWESDREPSAGVPYLFRFKLSGRPVVRA